MQQSNASITPIVIGGRSVSVLGRIEAYSKQSKAHIRRASHV